MEQQIDQGPVLALDIGGSKLALALVDRQGDLLMHQRRPTADVAGGEELVQWVGQQVKRWGVAPTALGISTGGPLDDVQGMVTRMPRMAMLWGFPLAEGIRQYIPSLTDVRLVNDACAACAGEALFGAGQGLENVLYLTISTGIGGGALIGGVLLRGDRGNVAEFGHIIVQPEGPLCDCGARGCLEAVASASGLFKQFMALGILEPQERGWADLGPWLRERLEDGDPEVEQVWDHALAGLATGLASLWHCYVPQAMILGGGLSTLVFAHQTRLIELLNERAQLVPVADGVLRFSESRHTIPLLGAAAVAAGWVSQEKIT